MSKPDKGIYDMERIRAEMENKLRVHKKNKTQNVVGIQKSCKTTKIFIWLFASLFPEVAQK